MGEAPPCPKCGEKAGPQHALLGCKDPSLANARVRLRTELGEARRREWEERAEAALWRGQNPPSKAILKGTISEKDLTDYPAEVLRFISRGRFWIDLHVRSALARKG